MATIAVFGGTGYSGGNIAREAISRGHHVISYSRHPAQDPVPGVDYRVGDLADDAIVAEAASAADDVVVALVASAYPDGLASRVPALTAAVIENDARLSFVGGAGSSLVAPGGPRLVDTPDFHADWKPEALAHAAVLEALRESDDALRWFYVSPAGLYGSYALGEATGAYRDGGDLLVTKEDGSSEISGADYALAYVDEIERGAHPRQRFTVGH